MVGLAGQRPQVPDGREHLCARLGVDPGQQLDVSLPEPTWVDEREKDSEPARRESVTNPQRDKRLRKSSGALELPPLLSLGDIYTETYTQSHKAPHPTTPAPNAICV